MKPTSVAVATVLVLAAVGSGVASANLTIIKKAKDAGYAATGCTYCHVDKMPKKDAHEWNARGKYLVERKQKEKAKDVDVNWLKDYKEPEEKK